MPIIEADRLLNVFHSGRLRDYNVLLLWSIFFVAVNVRNVPLSFPQVQSN